MISRRCFFSRRVEAVILARKSPVVMLTIASSAAPHGGCHLCLVRGICDSVGRRVNYTPRVGKDLVLRVRVRFLEPDLDPHWRPTDGRERGAPPPVRYRSYSSVSDNTGSPPFPCCDRAAAPN